jgi:signal transduction histidine kinase
VIHEADAVRAANRVVVDVSDVVAVRVTGDRRQLARAIRNLAENAHQHARSRVTFTLRTHDGAAELTVADDGTGVPEEQRERIFERFTRIDDARARDGGGTGLGLAIVREIIERHGGSAHLDTRNGAGARFVVRIPSASDECITGTDFQ